MSGQVPLFDESAEVRLCDPWPADMPWPGTRSPVYGFAPAAITQAHTRLRELAAVVIGDRPDAAFLLPVLITTLRVSLSDFVRVHQGDASEGFESPEARRAFYERHLQAMQTWDAQLQLRKDGTT
jgi:hypothetical protein